MSLSNYLNIVLSVVIAALLTVIAIQHESIKYFDTEYKAISEKISELEIQSQNESERYKQAQEQADQEELKSDQQVRVVMSDKVPEECDQAIQWGVDEAREFSA